MLIRFQHHFLRGHDTGAQGDINELAQFLAHVENSASAVWSLFGDSGATGIELLLFSPLLHYMVSAFI